MLALCVGGICNTAAILQSIAKEQLRAMQYCEAWSCAEREN